MPLDSKVGGIFYLIEKKATLNLNKWISTHLVMTFWVSRTVAVARARPLIWYPYTSPLVPIALRWAEYTFATRAEQNAPRGV